MCFGKRTNERVRNERPLVPGWLCGHPCVGVATVLHSVTKGKSYQWNLEMASMPGELVHLMLKEMQTNKKVKYKVPQLLLSGITK